MLETQTDKQPICAEPPAEALFCSKTDGVAFSDGPELLQDFLAWRITADEYAQAFRKGYPLTLRFLVSQGALVDAAEEIAQAAWAKGWEYRGQLQNANLVGVWVNSIAKNMFRNHFRHGRRIETLSESTMVCGSDLTALEVRGILRRCKAKDRIVLRRHYLEGYTTDEIAEEIGLTPSAVRVRLVRIRQALRSRLRVAGSGSATGRRFSAHASPVDQIQ